MPPVLTYTFGQMIRMGISALGGKYVQKLSVVRTMQQDPLNLRFAGPHVPTNHVCTQACPTQTLA